MAKILIIDDDPQTRRLVVRILTDAKHDVIEAVDGQKGIEQFHAYRPAVVITDILMPNKDGIEVIKELRRIAPKVRIIAISGGGECRNMTFLEFAMAFGANAALAKPFRPDDLIMAVAGTEDSSATSPPWSTWRTG